MELFGGTGPKFGIQFLGPTLDIPAYVMGESILAPQFAPPAQPANNTTKLTTLHHTTIANDQHYKFGCARSHQPVPLQTQSIGKSQGLEGLSFVKAMIKLIAIMQK